MIQPIVSILAPSYGHEAYIGAAVESVLAQSFRDWELIVVDDRSPDASLKVARGYRDSRVRVLENDRNLGPYGTQARALAEARGEWVAVLNTDDLWHPAKLELQLEASLGFDWSFCLGDLVDESGAVLGPADHDDWPVQTPCEPLPRLLSENRLLASAVMFRRGAARFETSLRTSGDWHLALTLAWRGPAAAISDRLVGWRQHPRNSYLRSPAVTLEEIRMRRAILSRGEAWRRGRFDRREIDQGLGRCALDQCALYVLAGFPSKARRMADLAVELMPGNRTARRRRALVRMPLVLARRRLWGKARSPVSPADLAGVADVPMPCDEKS